MQIAYDAICIWINGVVRLYRKLANIPIVRENNLQKQWKLILLSKIVLPFTKIKDTTKEL